MNIFITGGSGFLGTSIITKLIGEGHSVCALVRSEESSQVVQKLGATFVLGDIQQPKDFSGSLKGFDVAVHCAAPVEFWGPWEKFKIGIVDSTVLFANECARQNIKRFVHISSESVIQSNASLLDIDETFPYPAEPNSYYGKAKKLAEVRLLGITEKMEVVILRPTYIWGPDCPSFDTLIGKIKSGQFMWIDKGTASFEAVHVENVAEAVRLSLTQGRNRGIYFITDGEKSTTREFLENLFTSLNVPIPSKSIPNSIISPVAFFVEGLWKFLKIKSCPPITRFDLAFVAMPRRYNINRAKDELNYQPIIDRKKGFKQLTQLKYNSMAFDGNQKGIYDTQTTFQ